MTKYLDKSFTFAPSGKAPFWPKEWEARECMCCHRTISAQEQPTHFCDESREMGGTLYDANGREVGAAKVRDPKFLEPMWQWPSPPPMNNPYAELEGYLAKIEAHQKAEKA